MAGLAAAIRAARRAPGAARAARAGRGRRVAAAAAAAVPRRRMASRREDAEADEADARELEAFLREDGEEADAAHLVPGAAPRGEDDGTVGRVRELARGVAAVGGLGRAHVGSMVRFDGGLTGVVLGLERDAATVAVVDGDADRQGGGLASGQRAELTGAVASFPVGPAVLGRVLDAAGAPLDGGPPLPAEARRRPTLSGGAPNIVSRARVSELVRTGVLVLDSFQPLGRGMRYALMGPPQCGKTDTALAVVEGQAEQNAALRPGEGRPTRVVYVACGKTQSELGRIVEHLRETGALEHTTVVASQKGDPLPLQYMTPFAGCAVADELRDAGEHALIVYDDLTEHARAYQLLARSLRHPLDSLNYAHSRLLERSCALTPGKGGGSSTALCLVESVGEGLPFLVAENVGSSVDEAVYLDDALAASGVWPPVRSQTLVGKSFARFRPPVMRELMRRTHLRLVRSESAAEDAKFAREFGFEPEEESLPLIDHRTKVQEALFQREYIPLSGQLVTLFALNHGVLYDVPEPLVREYLKQLRLRLAAVRPDLAQRLDSDAFLREEAFPADAAAELDEVIAGFHPAFLSEHGLVAK